MSDAARSENVWDYFVGRVPLQVQVAPAGEDGPAVVEWRQPGERIPEAATWGTGVEPYINQGLIVRIPASASGGPGAATDEELVAEVLRREIPLTDFVPEEAVDELRAVVAASLTDEQVLELARGRGIVVPPEPREPSEEDLAAKAEAAAAEPAADEPPAEPAADEPQASEDQGPAPCADAPPSVEGEGSEDQARGQGGAEPAPPAPEPSADFPRQVGGGWYELSNGERVQGADAANAAQAALAEAAAPPAPDAGS